MKSRHLSTARPAALALLVAASLAAALVALDPPSAGAAAHGSPIRHVVVIMQENHSFDNVLGKYCADVASGKIVRPGRGDGCSGATSGLLPDGSTIPLQQATDIVPYVAHTREAQSAALGRGKMDGFAKVPGCAPTDTPAYACFTQFSESQIPNIITLAQNFAISDRTFELSKSASWVGHMFLVAATADGFSGDNPHLVGGGTKGPGWGCDSGLSASWWSAAEQKWRWEPSCVPDASGNGPFTGPGTSPVPYVPTILDRLDSAGLSWKIYAGAGQGTADSGYQWSICPTFFECLGSAQDNNVVNADQVLSDASAGNLPSLSIVTPTFANSQHNHASMLQGDNWIGSVVSAIESGPQWSSTAIFISWDDCGCFYDHVNPLKYNPRWGVRVPLIIVSPYAKRGYTDSTPATTVSILAFVERIFGLAPLNPCGTHRGCTDDGNAYDFSNSFRPAVSGPLDPSVPMVNTPLPPSEIAYLAAHPGNLRDGT